MNENELLEALAIEFSLPEIEEGEITANMLAEKTNKSHRASLTFLHNKVKEGKMKCREVRSKSGGKEIAFRLLQ